MMLIKPRTRGKQRLRLIARVDRENMETLHAYAAFLGEDAEYVLNELIDGVLARDKDFVKWRAEHPGSHLPAGSARARRRAKHVQRDAAPRTAAAPTAPSSELVN